MIRGSAGGITSITLRFLKTSRGSARITFLSKNLTNRKAQLYAQALANEGGSAKDWRNNMNSIGSLINTLFGGTTK